MSKLSAKACETAKASTSAMERLLGDGDGLFLRVRPNGTKTWVIEYEFQARRRKYTIGVFDTSGAPGESITAWQEHGRLSLGQARAIPDQWKQERRAGRDPVGELEARLGAQHAAEEATRTAAAVEAAQPTVRDVIEQFMAKQMGGKKSAPAIRYRLKRLADLIGDSLVRYSSQRRIAAASDNPKRTTMTERIQLKRTKGWRMPANAVKVDRTTKWGNPFKTNEPLPAGTQNVAQAFAHHIAHATAGARLAEDARAELRGKQLACWCAIGDPCHADVLLAIANAPPPLDEREPA